MKKKYTKWNEKMKIKKKKKKKKKKTEREKQMNMEQIYTKTINIIKRSNMVFHALTFSRSRGRCWKPRPKAAVYNTSQGIWRMLMHWKTMFETICYIRIFSCTILYRLFTDVSRTLFPRTMLVLGQGSTHLVTEAILWTRYKQIENCVAVH